MSDIHNSNTAICLWNQVVLDCKVIKFEWYTQPLADGFNSVLVVLDCKVIKFEWYTQQKVRSAQFRSVVLDCKVTKFEWYM